MNAPLTWGQAARTLAVEFAARAAGHDRDASFPFENFSQLHDAGLLVLAAPCDLGGQGATLAQLGEVIGAIGHRAGAHHAVHPAPRHGPGRQGMAGGRGAPAGA